MKTTTTTFFLGCDTIEINLVNVVVVSVVVSVVVGGVVVVVSVVVVVVVHPRT